MSKTALYSKLDVFEDSLDNIIFVDYAIEDVLGCETVDGYTELARSKIKQLKLEVDFDKNSNTTRSYLAINNKAHKAALRLVKNKEALQFWCDLAQWDCDKVKEWLLNSKQSMRKYTHAARKKL